MSVVRTLAFMAALAAGPALAQDQLSIATGGTGGVYYPMGGGLAEVINKHVEGYQATAEVTGASVENMGLIATGDADLAIGLADTVQQSLSGTGRFEGQQLPMIRAMASLYAHMVQIDKGQTKAPNLERLIADRGILKLFHFGRFDIAALYHAFGALAEPVYCTKIASKLVRTYTDRHGLKNLLDELLGVDISKLQQMSDWGAAELTEAQLNYAASDVLYLHQLKEKLDERLAREGRTDLAEAAFEFLPTRARLDLAGWPEIDIFAH